MQGFYALALGGETVSLEHLWVRPERIGHGLGWQLVEHAVQAVRTSGVLSLTVESDPNAEGFYRHLGFQRIGWVQADAEETVRRLPLLRLELTEL